MSNECVNNFIIIHIEYTAKNSSKLESAEAMVY